MTRITYLDGRVEDVSDDTIVTDSSLVPHDAEEVARDTENDFQKQMARTRLFGDGYVVLRYVHGVKGFEEVVVGTCVVSAMRGLAPMMRVDGVKWERVAVESWEHEALRLREELAAMAYRKKMMRITLLGIAGKRDEVDNAESANELLDLAMLMVTAARKRIEFDEASVDAATK